MSEPVIDRERFRLFLWHEWRWLWDKDCYNWIDIHWCWVHTEYSPYKDSVEVNFGLCGFCISMDWYYGTLEEERPVPHD